MRLMPVLILAIFTMCLSDVSGTAKKRHRNHHNKIAISSNSTKVYTAWSPWSRCKDCLQRRLKKCIHPSCDDSLMYEEKPCGKKRCKRKSRQKNAELHVINLYEDSSDLLRQAPSKVWGRWSRWAPCSGSCTTSRIRNCRRPGRCRKKRQEQTAYCYQDNSHCEHYVLALLDNQNRRHHHHHDYHVAENINIYGYEEANPSKNPRTQKKKTQRCGMPYRKSKMLRIIGGEESVRHKWPWHVAILNKFMEVFCGGTLIAPRWVLTASHCIRPFLSVRLNEHDLHSTDGSEHEMVVHKMFRHPKFNHETVDNDIALLQLPYAVKSPYACLPNKKPEANEMCYVMGWGKIKASDTYGTNRLHEAQLPVVASNVCRRSYRKFLITHNMLCAGWKSGRSDTCAGDSGGGLMCPYKKSQQSKVTVFSVQGITSFGDGCGLRNKYGIYTTVFNYLEWIHYVIDHY